jgi:apolipoprotein N-acyltransferase
MSTYAMSPSVAVNDVEVRSQSKPRSYARLGIATVFTAVIANMLVYFAGDAAIGYDPDFLVLSNVSGIAIFTFVPAVVSVLLYAALLRKTSRPERVFTIIATVLLVLSVIPDFTIIPSEEGASNGQTAILVLTHVVAAGIIVGMLTKYVRGTRSRTS